MTGPALRIVVTGASGLLGRHAVAHLQAANRQALARGMSPRFDIVALDHAAFGDDARLMQALRGAGAVLHFAGVSRGDPARVAAGNPALARRLVATCRRVGARPHLVHANSIRCGEDTPYGRSKRAASALLAKLGGGFCDLILPHVFGEGGRAGHNSVTANFLQAVQAGQRPLVDPAGHVALVHAGQVARQAIRAATDRLTGALPVAADRPMTVPALYARILALQADYRATRLPDLQGGFDRALYSSYLTALDPSAWLRPVPAPAAVQAAQSAGWQLTPQRIDPGDRQRLDFSLFQVRRIILPQGPMTVRLQTALVAAAPEILLTGAGPLVLDLPALCAVALENSGPVALEVLVCSGPTQPSASAPIEQVPA